MLLLQESIEMFKQQQSNVKDEVQKAATKEDSKADLEKTLELERETAEKRRKIARDLAIKLAEIQKQLDNAILRLN